MFHAFIPTPLGPMLAVADDDHLCGLHFEGDRHGPAQPPGAHLPGHPVLTETARQIAEYFAGERRRFHLPLRLAGTSFQQSAWALLCQVDYGQTVSYGWMAQGLGKPRATRAVGAANSRNPVSIVVPCHRAVGADGSLTGYAAGVARKQALLDLEGASLARIRPARPRARLADLEVAA